MLHQTNISVPLAATISACLSCIVTILLTRTWTLRKKPTPKQQRSSMSAAELSPNKKDPYSAEPRQGYCNFAMWTIRGAHHLVLCFAGFTAYTCILLKLLLDYCRYLSWDDYFMSVAFLSAQRSKDPNKQVMHAQCALTSPCRSLLLACLRWMNIMVRNGSSLLCL